MTRFRFFFAALLVAVAAMAAPPGILHAQEAAAASPQAHQPEPAAAGHPEKAAGHESAGEAAHEDPGWFPVIAKAVNFALLIGILAYFLRTPLAGYLNGRIGKVREDLLTAKQTRETAVRQLAEIDAKLAALPAELAALKKRGAEDLVAERTRIEQDALVERQRVLEHTRREIDMRLRVAKRELLELGASLAVGVAAERIRTSITPDDQARLVDRYTAQLQTGSGPGRGGRAQ
jgi:F-type H+-transporting ATPase subunit b